MQLSAALYDSSRLSELPEAGGGRLVPDLCARCWLPTSLVRAHIHVQTHTHWDSQRRRPGLGPWPQPHLRLAAQLCHLSEMPPLPTDCFPLLRHPQKLHSESELSLFCPESMVGCV